MSTQHDQKPQEPINQQVQENVQNVVEKAQQEVVRSRVPWYRVSRRAQFLVGLYLVLFALFSVLAWFVHVHPILPVDVAITQEFQESQMPWLSGLMIFISYLGYQPVLFTALVIATALLFWMLRLRLEALFIVGVSLISSLLNVLIKYLVSRPRPTTKLVEVFQVASGQSFPSGHVMSYVAFFGLLFSFGLILLKRDRWWHYVVLIISGLFVLLVGPSRVYLGAHWASDVLGAYLIGGLLLSLSLRLYLALKRRHVLAPPDHKPGEQLVEPPATSAHASP